MTNIYAVMPTKNEASRYLEAVIENLDCDIFIYDDRSEDHTPHLARALGAHVEIRPPHVPSFLEHEGLFRQAAWNAFEQAAQPKRDDLIIAVDADEFPVGDFVEAQQLLVESGAVSMRIEIPEIFDGELNENGTYVNLLRRVDGAWGKIAGMRIFRYQEGGVFHNKAMGCGSEPTYVEKNIMEGRNLPFKIVHVGYLDQRDREAKFSRYSQIAANGHANRHVQSILQQPKLVPHEGTIPYIWRAD